MKSLASLAVLLLASGATGQEPPAGSEPRGSSQGAPGEARYDAVGRAALTSGDGLVGVSARLPAGSFAEVTSLDSGRTIVVAVSSGDVPPDSIIGLSAAAARLLDLRDPVATAVRVRSAVVSPQDAATVRAGGSPVSHADAPPALIAALRRRLAAQTDAPASAEHLGASVAARKKPPAPRTGPARTGSGEPSTAPERVSAAVPAPPSATKPVPASAPARVRAGFVVQVAAFSTARRAASAAASLGGSIVPGPPVWRVRLGPFTDATAAARAKADVGRRGYPGAQIIRYP